MASTLLSKVNKIHQFSNAKRSLTLGKIICNKPAGTSNTQDVPGLSENCVKIPNNPVGPGAAKDTGYKNPEYFCYDKNSYFEAEVEMLKHRCPQPSISTPYFHDSK